MLERISILNLFMATGPAAAGLLMLNPALVLMPELLIPAAQNIPIMTMSPKIMETASIWALMLIRIRLL